MRAASPGEATRGLPERAHRTARHPPAASGPPERLRSRATEEGLCRADELPAIWYRPLTGCCQNGFNASSARPARALRGRPPRALPVAPRLSPAWGPARRRSSPFPGGPPPAEPPPLTGEALPPVRGGTPGPGPSPPPRPARRRVRPAPGPRPPLAPPPVRPGPRPDP
ncbi:hypothetical protein CP974_10510 [Streptomyces fradiae ATCC 10745 = DSM 40063]|nr:hypothetical protein CP974_10510 [Streptomyces fradiae ATCC 10745 = DSM 40063]